MIEFLQVDWVGSPLRGEEVMPAITERQLFVRPDFVLTVSSPTKFGIENGCLARLCDGTHCWSPLDPAAFVAKHFGGKSERETEGVEA